MSYINCTQLYCMQLKMHCQHNKNMEKGKKEISNALLNAYIKKKPYSNDVGIKVSDTL